MRLFKGKQFKTGLLAPDPKDVRDYLLSSIQPVSVALPEEFDLRNLQSPVQNQDGLGICHSFMTAGIGEYWNTKEYKTPINLSEKFIVYNTKRISGLWDIQADYLRNSLKAFCDFGSPLEADYPFSNNWGDYKKEPSAEIYKKAGEFKGKTFWRVDAGLESIKQAVFQNLCPLAFGMSWFESYNKMGSDGKLPLPSGKKEGHAISGGYWTRGKVWFKNSWDKDWGSNGYFYIPFAEFSKHEIWDVSVLLDLPKPVIVNEGFVAQEYLKFDELLIGNKVSPIIRLNLRKEPAGEKVLTLDKGQSLIVVGDARKVGSHTWIKVKIL